MTEFLDDVARSLAIPMPRRRAIRILGGALAAATVPAALRPGRASAHASAATLCEPKQCKPPLPYLCDCRGSKPGNCNSTCGVAGSTCCCFKDADGTLTGLIACPPETRCGRPGEPACVYECKKKCGDECCDENEGCCRVLPTPGSGEKAGAGKCCSQKLPKCCANDQRANCCDPADNCCAGRCCPPDKTCKDGVCKCPKGTSTCGRECCTGKEKCCPGKTCCKPGETCCGQECCGKNETCSNEKCCPKGKVNCGGNGTCCDEADCCSGDCCGKDETCLTTRFLAASSSASSRAAIRRICCPKPRVLNSSFCCPPGTVATRGANGRFRCCPRAIPDCCNEDSDEGIPCLPPLVCVSGACRRLP